jgi:hypothetical protein
VTSRSTRVANSSRPSAAVATGPKVSDGKKWTWEKAVISAAHADTRIYDLASELVMTFQNAGSSYSWSHLVDGPASGSYDGTWKVGRR